MTDRYDFEILPVCLGLHMAHTGSADPLPAEDKARHVTWLRQRLAEWQPSHAKWERFDEAVKALIIATLDEVDPMPLDVLTPDEQDLVIASIPLQTGLTRDGERVIAAAEPRRCVAVLATDAEDRVLLVLSAKPGRAWELPGGGVNRAESAVDAAYREVLEETGIAIVSIEGRRIIPGTPKPGAQYPSTIYVMTASGAGDPKPGSDANGADWYTRDEVLGLHARGRLSDLASREDLLSWANETALTPEEEREAYQFGRLTGIGFAAGKQAIEESKARRKMPAAITSEEAEAQLRALGQSSDMAAALVRNARAVLSQGHTIGLTAESAPKLHAILAAYVGAK